MNYRFLLDLAIILFSTKMLGLLAKKIGLPQVVGAIVAGLIIGPVALGLVQAPDQIGAILRPGENTLADVQDPIKFIAEIGVILILFSAGMSTNLSEMKKNGVASIVITVLGVVVPFALGLLSSALYFNNWSFDLSKLFADQKQLVRSLFFGTILTATSVGITVETLNELGRLKGKVGASIMGAAIIDDVIGIIILTVVIGMDKNAEAAAMTGKTVELGEILGEVLLRVFLFFLAAIAVGLILHYLFKALGKRYNNKRRLPIISLSVCFLFAFIAESVFKIADITGAYIAGVFMANLVGSDYVERKIDVSSYMIFSPVFFARIGITADLSHFNTSIIGFSILFVVVGLLSKYIGCSVGAKMCGFSNHESSAVGIGMMVRGEVALVVAAKGQDLGILDPSYIPAVVLLIITSSILSPILLKQAFKHIPYNANEETNQKKSKQFVVAMEESGHMTMVTLDEKYSKVGPKHLYEDSNYSNNIGFDDREVIDIEEK